MYAFACTLYVYTVKFVDLNIETQIPPKTWNVNVIIMEIQ